MYHIVDIGDRRSPARRWSEEWVRPWWDQPGWPLPAPPVTPTVPTKPMIYPTITTTGNTSTLPVLSKDDKAIITQALDALYEEVSTFIRERHLTDQDVADDEYETIAAIIAARKKVESLA